MRISKLLWVLVLVLASIVLWNLSWSLTRVHGSLRRDLIISVGVLTVRLVWYGAVLLLLIRIWQKVKNLPG